jgi:hypothetical protein
MDLCSFCFLLLSLQNIFEAIIFNNQATIEMTNPVQSSGIRNPYPTRTMLRVKQAVN